MLYYAEGVRANPDKLEYQCDCPPPCTDEWFEPEISYATFPGHGFKLSRTFQRLVDKINVSSKEVEHDPYFKYTSSSFSYKYFINQTNFDLFDKQK